MKSFFDKLENIVKGVVNGIEKAAPFVAKFGGVVPGIGPVLQEAANVIIQLESKGATLTPDEVEQIITVISTAAHLKAGLVGEQATPK